MNSSTSRSAAPSHDQVRRQLTARRGELAARRQRIQTDLTRRETPLVADSADRAIQLENDETLQVIGALTLTELAAIDDALVRLDQGLYGICKHCGERIEPVRLRAVPQAVTCACCARN